MWGKGFKNAGVFSSPAKELILRTKNSAVRFLLHQMGDLIRNTYKGPAGHKPYHRQAKKNQQDTFHIALYRTQN